MVRKLLGTPKYPPYHEPEIQPLSYYLDDRITPPNSQVCDPIAGRCDAAADRHRRTPCCLRRKGPALYRNVAAVQIWVCRKRLEKV